jgi:hypothetical protein
MTDEQGVVRIWDELGELDLTWINAINKLPDAKRLVELLRSGAPMSLGIRDLLAELLDPGEPDIMGGKLVYQKTSNIFEKIVGRTVQNKKTGEITVKYSKLQVIADYCELMGKGESSQEAAKQAGAIHGITDKTVYNYLAYLRRVGARLRGK